MQPPVLLISMDTVRQDLFDEECFPCSWPILTEEFTRFPNSISHGVATPHAFPGIFTGYPVVRDGEFPSDAVTLADLFTEGKTIGFSNNGHLRPDRGYGQGFDFFDDVKPPTNRDLAYNSVLDRIKDNEQVQNSTILRKFYSWYQSFQEEPPYAKPNLDSTLVTDWVIAQYENELPEFVWAHYMDAHKPFIPEYAVNGPDIELTPEELSYLNEDTHADNPVSKENRDILWKLYKSNIRFVDQEIARLLNKLRTFDWYSDALIILVADHGELFGEHGHMWHPWTIDPVDELIDTPLAVKFPNQRYAGDVLEHRVQHADILNTVETKCSETNHAPEHTFPLLNSADRVVISKSNTSIRVTGPAGYAVRRRDGSKDEYGTVTDEMQHQLEKAQFPRVKTTKGTIQGIEDIDREKQLKALGYR